MYHIKYTEYGKIEIPIGTTLLINGRSCVVKTGRSCSKCAIQKMTANRKTAHGTSLKCGTNNTGNTSDFACHKDDRTDKTNIFFEQIP